MSSASVNDEIRWAKTRLSCYRALSSAVYIVLQSQDPFLSSKLKALSIVETYYKVGTISLNLYPTLRACLLPRNCLVSQIFNAMNGKYKTSI